MIIIHYDNREVVRDCHVELIKTIQGASEEAFSICEIRRLLKEIAIPVLIELTKAQKKKQVKFYDNPLVALILECDRLARKKMNKLRIGRIEEKEGVYREYALLHKGVFADRSVSEVIRLIDTEKSEAEYARKQVGED